MIQVNAPKILAETADYFVIDKPAGYSVEPHETYPSITDWLDEHYALKRIMKSADRFGIVHRLDVETSGVLIWAKNALTQQELQKTWQGRAVKKTYLALVVGETPEEGSIELAIERDNRRDRMRVALLPTPKARPAITTYQRVGVGKFEIRNSKFEIHKLSLLECYPITGRTHQIRVHLQSIGHPIIGDKLYGSKLSDLLAESLDLDRQFLHAQSIELDDCVYRSPPPVELANVLTALKIKLA